MESDGTGIQKLESRFQLNDQRVWFGKAKLLADRISLKGWGYRRIVMLNDIVEVRWAGNELILVTSDGDEIDMIISAAALWKFELQTRCGLQEAPSQNVDVPVLSSRNPGAPVDLRDGSTPGDGQSRDLPELDDIVDSTGSSLLERPDSVVADESKTPGEQTEMFLEQESSYRIRSSFAEDRPHSPKRADDATD